MSDTPKSTILDDSVWRDLVLTALTLLFENEDETKTNFAQFAVIVQHLENDRIARHPIGESPCAFGSYIASVLKNSHLRMHQRVNGDAPVSNAVKEILTEARDRLDAPLAPEAPSNPKDSPRPAGGVGSVDDAEVGDVYTDGDSNKLYRVLAVYKKPTVVMEAVEGTLYDPLLDPRFGSEMPKHAKIIRQQQSGPIDGFMWRTWRRVFRPRNSIGL